MVLLMVGMALDNVVRVKDSDGLLAACRTAKPGLTILLEPGEYRGGVHLVDLHGVADSPITIRAADKANPPVFVGGGSSVQISEATHLVVSDIVVKGASGNGVNIDDGGTYDTPSHHIILRNIRVSDLPTGNHDGIKLSGIDDFEVINCEVSKWGGSAIDMVGCHRGKVRGGRFLNGGSSGVQMKGGTSQMQVEKCWFENYGDRGVNIGGSTGRQFFRPVLESAKEGARYEAKEIRVEGCTFVGGVAPVAFVGVDGAVVRFNTIYHPIRWAIRILQETTEADFVPCRNGVFESNLVVFRSDAWFSGGVNIGAKTAPQTFQFKRNFWFCSDRPERSQPSLPTAESDGVVGKNPLLNETLGVKQDSPASKVGAHAFVAK